MSDDPYRPLAPDEVRLYLDRIGFEGAPGSDAEGLAALHKAHFYSFPFENLDMHRGLKIRMETRPLVDKLILARRGGVCYELNLLLYAALRGMGFDTRVISGRMQQKDGSYGPPLIHMALIVRFEDAEFVADAGDGESFQWPLPINGPWVPQFRGGAWRAVLEGTDGHVDHRLADDGEVTTKYLFDPAPRHPSDFDDMLTWHTTSPDSRFTKGWIATLPRGRDSRITVSRGMLMETIHGKMQRRALESPADLLDLLEREFGMAPFDIPESWFRRS